MNLFKAINVTSAVDLQNQAQALALTIFAANPGVYHLSEIGVHTVSAVVAGNNYYSYDPDENGAGDLHEFTSRAEWKQLVAQHYKGVSVLGVRQRRRATEASRADADAVVTCCEPVAW